MEIHVGLGTPLVEIQQFCEMDNERGGGSLPRYILKAEREKKEEEMIHETIRLLTP